MASLYSINEIMFTVMRPHAINVVRRYGLKFSPEAFATIIRRTACKNYPAKQKTTDRGCVFKMSLPQIIPYVLYTTTFSSM